LLLACGCACAARQNDDETRKLALTQLQSRDADVRLAACTLLAKVGKQEDLRFSCHICSTKTNASAARPRRRSGHLSRSGDAAPIACSNAEWSKCGRAG